jgi:hypothetical protein
MSRELSLYIVLHNSTKNGEETTFKMEKLWKFYIPYVDAQHIFRGLKSLADRLIPMELGEQL